MIKTLENINLMFQQCFFEGFYATDFLIFFEQK